MPSCGSIQSLTMLAKEICKLWVYIYRISIQTLILYYILSSDQTFVLQYVANVLSRYENNTMACAWLMDYLGKLQSFLSVDQIKDPQCYFLFDFFILSIVVLSGYGSLLENVNSRAHRNNLFPESLAGLFKIGEWRDCSTRVCVL